MSLSFEVRETDLMGRIGVLTVGKKSVETPCLTPVIHPLSLDITVRELRDLGFTALMTNSYIIYKRRREEVLERGLHGFIGHDGIVMTDSGGYQVLEYGDAEVTPEQIADFQSRIGSDLAVTLDTPTGYSTSRAYASRTMEGSLEAAVSTLRSSGGSETVWVGPIQGGLFGDLVRSSARRMVKAGFRMVALGSPVELMEGYLFSELAEMIVNARKSIPFSMPLHLFGAGHPLTTPLSIALGCDTFDSASYILFAKEGRYMTERGTLDIRTMAYLPCSCPVCNATSRADLVEMESGERTRRMALHNLHVLRADVLRCKEAIVEGRLWDLVEERAMAHPRLAVAFRALTKHARWLSKPTRLLKDRGMLLRTPEDAGRPELLLANQHLAPVVRRRAKEARVLATPVARPSPKSAASARVVDYYRVHPELGPFPAELQFVFPFTQTVSDRDVEPRIRDAVRRLRAMGYSRVTVVRNKKKPPRNR